MRDSLSEVIVGQSDALDHVLVALLTGGHVLLTGGAATAKGLLVQCLSRTAQLDFKRVQFTPDLMPSDITGSEVLEEGAKTEGRATRFVSGPVFTNLLLADEINRTPPKTQAALLEAMQEKQVTSGGVTRPLPQPFFVMATKTSAETDGTYALPEAQQDRFMLNVEMQPLSEEEEMQVVLDDPLAHMSELTEIIDGEGLISFQQAVREVTIPKPVQKFIVDLCAASRPNMPGANEAVTRYIAWGAGVRATQCLALGCKARAAMEGRSAATSTDVRAIALPVMRHRIGVNFRAENEGITSSKLVGMLVESVKAPA
jgi:MoxR-like ATPase